ncbi:hypothetical protein CHUAL_008258 [Chamberlinius hualienensis]
MASIENNEKTIETGEEGVISELLNKLADVLEKLPLLGKTLFVIVYSLSATLGKALDTILAPLAPITNPLLDPVLDDVFTLLNGTANLLSGLKA